MKERRAVLNLERDTLTAAEPSQDAGFEERGKYEKKLAGLRTRIVHLNDEIEKIEKQRETLLQALEQNRVQSDSFVVNMQICFAYTGDGWRPLDPRSITADEIKALHGGEVYYVAQVKDLGSDTESVRINSDVMRQLIVSNELTFNSDLYYGSPTDALMISVGVYDDDGWPSDRDEQLVAFQKSLGTVLTAFGAPEDQIPFVEYIPALIIGTMNLVDPDDTLLVARAFVTKSVVSGKTYWTIHSNSIRTDNGTIRLSILPPGL